MFIMKRFMAGSAIGGAGCLIVLVLAAMVLAANTALVALVWNTAGLHHVFGAGTLSLWQCVAAAVLLGMLGG